jgi:hypothetical protein
LAGAIRRLARLTHLFSCPLRFASRLAQLLLGLTEFAFELLQFALKLFYLALDCIDPGARSILRSSRDRHHRYADCNQRAAEAIAIVKFGPHASPSPL